MFPAVPPAFLLAILLILLSTQVAYVVWPRRPNYLFRLALSAVAFGLGELGATVILGSRLALGDLHPAVDLVLLAGLQLAATRWAGRDEEPPPRQPGLGGRRSR
ncbi:MAG: hypothetical protein E6H92_05620 [Chloroflexi bacterium]|nr:MAG: hypothetical protein E6H92_05620 [Chloroflexota bacterium]